MRPTTEFLSFGTTAAARLRVFVGTSARETIWAWTICARPSRVFMNLPQKIRRLKLSASTRAWWRLMTLLTRLMVLRDSSLPPKRSNRASAGITRAGSALLLKILQWAAQNSENQFATAILKIAGVTAWRTRRLFPLSTLQSSRILKMLTNLSEWKLCARLTRIRKDFSRNSDAVPFKLKIMEATRAKPATQTWLISSIWRKTTKISFQTRQKS